LASFAPQARDSGTVRGARTTFGHWAKGQTALYMASVASLRSNPILKAFYKRLRAACKAGKLALVAVARKLLTIINAMIRDIKRWQPHQTVAKA